GRPPPAPVVPAGPAIYGMFRIISRSRRGAKGAGYGWLLVGCGTLASIGGDAGPAQPGPGARAWSVTRAAAPAHPAQLPEAPPVRRSHPTVNLDPAPALGSQRWAL